MEGSFRPSSVEQPTRFSSPEEEVFFLRQQLAARERELLFRQPEIDPVEREALGRQELREYSQFTPKSVLHPEYELQPQELAEASHMVEVSTDPVAEVLELAKEKGIKNALSVLERTANAYTIDEVHRRLIEDIHAGVSVADIKEGVPPWHILHMTLYEVALPRNKDVTAEDTLTDRVGRMQQLLSGLRTSAAAQYGNHITFEIAVANGSDDIIFYVAVPDEYRSLFEKQALALFPHAVLTVQAHDYNVYVEGGHTYVVDVALKRHPIYPLKPVGEFTADPLEVLMNAFTNIEREGGGAAVQFIVQYPSHPYHKQYSNIVRAVEQGEKPVKAISESTLSGQVFAGISDFFSSTKKKTTDEPELPKEVDTEALETFRSKIATDIVEVNIRLVVSADSQQKAEQIRRELEAAFQQFNTLNHNQLVFKELVGLPLRKGQKAFSFRQFTKSTALPLSVAELATLMHLPAAGAAATPQVKQSSAQSAAAPTNMPTTGTLLGINQFRGSEKQIFITDEDRLRHFYIIGQTGTGKTNLMKNMIVQDILRGDGVCMIDPHGTDIEDVLGAVPPEREGDVIYFDPSRTDRVIGLNMLEYDVTKPEQKTFVVNELFSIFQKLYGGNPESMGPMFEQYFRNATMLVMEDPESGNTLMDIGRVMSDAKYRREKLAKAKNPVVVSFWKEIATKAGGEASLENIVPYIVSKFDVFTANDYMRPIIGQQHSAFNFRKIMDERKILLVNLSKGRLGEINANLIGMIFVGKLLMAALSRVDDPSKSFPPFYLHMDEFQNISTNSISAILSEARKYKLGLTVAHQFIAQLQPDIRDAVFGNVGSMAAFRVGPEDATALEHQFAPTFTASDLMNVPNRTAFMRVLANGTPTPPFSMATLPPRETDLARVASLIEASYARYGRAREEIEVEIEERYRKPAPIMPPIPPQV